MNTPSDTRVEVPGRDVAGDLAPEHRVIVDLVPEGSSVLDLGCGNGDLLAALVAHKRVRAAGIEIACDCIQACVARGIANVHQGDLDEGLADYADHSVDIVILTGTIQVLQQPLRLIKDMARVGRRCIIGFPNFAHWQCRAQLALAGRMPVTERLPHQWYETPNIHLTTMKDFRDFCATAGLTVLQQVALKTSNGRPRQVRCLPNLRADYAVFVVTAGQPPAPASSPSRTALREDG